jgi:Flp pilus assembly protein TadG
LRSKIERIGFYKIMMRFLQHGWRDDRASQIVEFAVSLPLLMLFVVGIFDFSGAFSLKQKLANAAQQGARVAAADPANDLSNTLPASVSDAFQVVDNYLINAKVDDCGLSGATATGGGGTMTWTYTASSCTNGAGTLTLTINRGYTIPQPSSTAATANCSPQSPNGQLTLIATCVSIQYPYSWRFARVASLVGSTTSPPGTFSTTAVALNEN